MADELVCEALAPSLDPLLVFHHWVQAKLMVQLVSAFHSGNPSRGIRLRRLFPGRFCPHRFGLATVRPSSSAWPFSCLDIAVFHAVALGYRYSCH